MLFNLDDYLYLRSEKIEICRDGEAAVSEQEEDGAE